MRGTRKRLDSQPLKSRLSSATHDNRSRWPVAGGLIYHGGARHVVSDAPRQAQRHAMRSTHSSFCRDKKHDFCEAYSCACECHGRRRHVSRAEDVKRKAYLSREIGRVNDAIRGINKTAIGRHALDDDTRG